MPGLPQNTSPGLDWLAGLLSRPIATFKKSFGDKPPEAPAPAIPETPGAPNLSPFGLPTTPLSRQNAGAGPINIPAAAPSWKPGDPSILPPAPQMAQAPPQEYPGGADFSQARKWMDTAQPKPPDAGQAGDANVSAVLGGLARGAGGVNATDAGSFAKALAMSGAGGAAGREKSFEDFAKRQDTYEGRRQQYGEARAGQEFQIAKSQHDYSVAKSQVDHQNAVSLIETKFKNDQLQFEQNMKEIGLRMPKIQNVPGGFITEQIMPDGRSERQFIDTRAHWEKLEGIGKTFAGLGMDSTVPQMQAIAAMGLPPPMQTEMLKELAVKEVISKGMGAAAFGKYYKEAATQIDAELKNDSAFSMLSASPATAMKAIEMRNNFIASRLLQRFAASGDSSWLQRIGDFSKVGAALTGRSTPPEGP